MFKSHDLCFIAINIGYSNNICERILFSSGVLEYAVFSTVIIGFSDREYPLRFVQHSKDTYLVAKTTGFPAQIMVVFLLC